MNARSHRIVCALIVFSSLSLFGAQAPFPVRALPSAVAGASAQPQGAIDAATAVAGVRAALQAHLGTPAVVEPVRSEPSRITVGRTAKGLVYRPGTGTPAQVPVELLQLHGKQAPAGVDRDLWVAREVLRQSRDLLRLEDPDSELKLDRRRSDELGYTHLRFSQQYKGVPVWPADLIVHLDREGEPVLINGAFVQTPRRIVTEPVVSQERAKVHAVAAVSWRDARVDTSELVIFADDGRLPRLAWKNEVEGALHERRMVVIDAMHGSVLASWSLVHQAGVAGSGVDLLGVTRQLNVWQSGGTFYLIDTSKPMYDVTSTPPSSNIRGGIVILDARNSMAGGYHFVTSASATSWSDSTAVSTAYNLSQVYDYYRERHSRNSMDGLGGTLKAVVHYGVNYLNAQFDPDTGLIIFGDAERFAASLDVVGHELTHGVIHAEGGLEYVNQSGALNEALSDIFGEMAEARARGTIDWIIGTELSNAPGMKRSMATPESFNQPSKMSDFRSMPPTREGDNGGVHVNSGIINKAYYLLAAGLPNAIGLRDAERIFYRALTVHLTRNSNFLKARLDCIQSAKELFGVNSLQAQRTAEAFDAVEIFDATAPPPQPPPPAVNAADSTMFLFKANGQSKLGRREAGFGDPLAGVDSGLPIARNRPSVTGDGSLAFVTTTTYDACFIRTALNQPPGCLGRPGQIASSAMSSDGTRYAFVFRDTAGNPTKTIYVIDIATGMSATFPLTVPVQDGNPIDAIRYADSMVFSPDRPFLLYDAFSVIRYGDGSEYGAWSIFALDLRNGQIFSIAGPFPGLEIGYPALSQRGGRYLTFDVQQGSAGSQIWVMDLFTGKAEVMVANSAYLGVASFTGDDTGLIFSFSDNTPTGFSIARLPLTDPMTAAGSPSVWMTDADFATIYRRGSYSAPSQLPGAFAFSATGTTGKEGFTVTIAVDRLNGVKGQVSVSYATNGGTATSGLDFTARSGTLSWADGESGQKSFTIPLLADAQTDPGESFSVSLGTPTNGATLGSPATVQINIVDQAPVTAGLRFVPVTPCRAWDTRGEGGILETNANRAFALAGRCGIPADAQAVSGNVTVVGFAGAGYLSVYTEAGAPTRAISTLNFSPGQWALANAAIVPLRSGAALTMFASQATHVILDVNGYFVAPSGTGGSTALGFQTITPCRVSDTRGEGGAMNPETFRAFPIAGRCTIPATARAVSANFTMTGFSGQGYLSAYTELSSLPRPISTMNFSQGQWALANAAVVPLRNDGGLTVFVASSRSDVIIDANGYFASDGPLSFHPVTPCRAWDTRGEGGALSANTFRAFTMAGRCGIPADAKAVSANFTTVGFSVPGYLSAYTETGSLPRQISTMNFSPGQWALANAAIVPLRSDGGLNVFMASSNSDVIIDVNGYFK